MPLESVCKKDVVTIKKDASLINAAGLMREYHVGSIVVVEDNDDKDIVVGMLTDRDIALAISSSSKVESLKVHEIMHSQPVTAQKTAGIYEAIELMKKNGIKRLPITEKNGSLFGMISADDLLDLIAEEISNLAKLTDIQVKKEKGPLLATEPQMPV